MFELLLDFPVEKMDAASSFEGQPLRTGPALASLLGLRLGIFLVRQVYRKPIFLLTWLKRCEGALMSRCPTSASSAHPARSCVDILVVLLVIIVVMEMLLLLLLLVVVMLEHRS